MRTAAAAATAVQNKQTNSKTKRERKKGEKEDKCVFVFYPSELLSLIKKEKGWLQTTSLMCSILVSQQGEVRMR